MNATGIDLTFSVAGTSPTGCPVTADTLSTAVERSDSARKIEN